MSTPDSTLIFENGRKIGSVKAGVFSKNISGSKHFVRNFGGGIAIGLAGLDQAEQAGAIYVRVLDRETGITYAATIHHLRQAGKPINFSGFGPQLLLPFSGWTRSGSNLPTLPDQPEQMTLWEVHK
jgi:hypothetical protein